MLQEHSAINLTCIKRKSVLKPIFGLLLEWPLKTGFTVLYLYLQNSASFSNFSVLSGLLSSAIIDLILQYNLKIRERNLAQKTNSGWNPEKDKENKTRLY